MNNKTKKLKLTNDAVFKFVFTQSRSSLLRLINSVLQWKEPIRKIETMPTESFGKGELGKKCVFDLRAFDDRGRQYNIEMQMQKQDLYLERSLFYWSRIYSEQAKKGVDYTKLKPTVGIHFLGVKMFDDLAFHSRVRAVREGVNHRTTSNIFSSHLDLHFIEMPKCVNVESELGMWIRVLTCAHKLSEDEMKNIIKEEPEFEETFQTFERASHIPAIVRAADMIEKAEADEISRRRTAMRIATEEGLEKGMQKGLEQGLQRGIKNGVKQIVLNLSKNGMGIDEISRCAGLSIEEIEGILQAKEK